MLKGTLNSISDPGDCWVDISACISNIHPHRSLLRFKTVSLSPVDTQSPGRVM